MKSKTLLALVCLLSLLLNVYFIYQFYTNASAQQVITSVPIEALPPQVNAATDELYRPLFSTATQSSQTAKAEPATQPSINRAELLGLASALLKEERFTQLRLFLRDYLQQHPLDMDFLLLEAQLNVNTELLSDAIAHYYSLTKLPMTAAQAKIISDSISELSGHTISQLQRAYSWDTLAIFVEPLLQLEPQNRLYILALAEAYAQQNQINLMENVLASLDYNDAAANKIRQLAVVTTTETEQISSEQTSLGQLTYNQASIAVPLQQVGDQYVVQGQLAGHNVSLLIDTGASITAISMPYFQSLKHSDKTYLGRFSVNTAAGQVLASMYQFSELKLNHAVVNNISVVVLPMRNIDKINGLLGMNFLREFDFKIDQRRSQLLLKQ